METNTQTPFEEVKTEETTAEVLTINRVEAVVLMAKNSFAELVAGTNFDEEAKKLKSQLKKLTISGINDKDNYGKVKEIVKSASKLRIAVENRRKEVKADTILAGKKIDELADTYQKLINPVEEDGKNKLKLIDDAKEEELNRELKAKEEQKQKRILELQDNGCPFTGQWWSINDISLGIQQIEESTDEQWIDIISKVKVQNEKNIQEAAAKKQKEEADRLEQERIAKEQKEKQDALDLKEKELNDKLARIEAAEKAENEKKEREEREAKELKERQEREAKELLEKTEREAKEKADDIIIAEKAKRYEAIGWKYSYQEERWEFILGKMQMYISKKDMLTNTDEDYEFNKSQTEEWIRNKEKADIEAVQAKLFSDRNGELIELGFTINGDGNFVIEEFGLNYSEEYIKATNNNSWLADTERVKTMWAAKVEQRRVSKQNDTQKYNDWIDKLIAIPIPEMKDENLKFDSEKIVKLFVKKAE